MRGNINIINSEQDKINAGISDKKIIAMCSSTVKTDTAKYPKNYDRRLVNGDKGYIPPNLKEDTVVNAAALKRFGVDL